MLRHRTLLCNKKNDLCNSVNNGEAEKNLKNIKELLEANWKFEISSQASNDLNMQKWNKVTLVPLASDLKLLKDYLILTAEAAADKLLKANNDEVAYTELLETVFCRIILLNRKRPGELQRLLLETYLKSEDSGQSNYEEFDNAMAPTEKILLKKFKRVVTRGKRGRGVPILFSDDVQRHVDILIKVRANFLGSDNLYLFGNPKCKSPIVGYKILEKYARLCGAKNPNSLTATRLRKHLATLTQIFNMTENDIEQLATFMGHTTGVHRQSYRLPDDVYQTAKISKLLLLMEKGAAAEYKGKALDEIDLNLEENLLNDKENLINEDTEEIPNYDVNDTVNSAKTVDCSAGNSSRITTKGKKRQLIPWTAEQISIVQSHFKNHINTKKPPKKWECEELIQKYPQLLKNKSWLKIKVYIQNKYTKKNK